MMSRQIKCECGFIVRGTTDDEVVAGIRGHMRSDHPELLDKLSDETIRSWIEILP
jgi:predicted small metal-binding protein